MNSFSPSGTAEPLDTSGPAAAEPLQYSCKLSLAGATRSYALAETGLAFTAGELKHFWPYRDIVRVTLTYRPVSQSRRFRADLENAAGERLPIASASWKNMAVLEPQTEAYRAFITELHRRLIAAGSSVRCVAGLNHWVYGAALALSLLTAIALVMLLLRSLALESWSPALILGVFALMFGWQAGNWLVRNRPRDYAPDAVPKNLLS